MPKNLQALVTTAPSDIDVALDISLYGQNAKHSFTLGKSEFLLDGKPFQIISGEMHPARIPAEYWRQRIQMPKA